MVEFYISSLHGCFDKLLWHFLTWSSTWNFLIDSNLEKEKNVIFKPVSFLFRRKRDKTTVSYTDNRVFILPQLLPLITLKPSCLSYCYTENLLTSTFSSPISWGSSLSGSITPSLSISGGRTKSKTKLHLQRQDLQNHFQIGKMQSSHYFSHPSRSLHFLVQVV